ncbi:glycerophosphodiester phosphodiesterase family protein [Acetobacterium woodii]|uniref:Glycerophosphoryl diester phosphodiesterase Glp n=1 Tax=Acetobacterium woodii (strain ATCC 29683 / DSM 1030 / JCM 2381 / KCTC 1655 / WB1) TaxID=931626 RepID=H6LKX7_ACEWD|nr:glycerophosphodiester phosphodiesterase family protein [Acetobacterium woodii]AFA50086.1 glycerophosphoryl diester phosphodiesterase Glp [Acetobacterium woodii DSM 1030]
MKKLKKRWIVLGIMGTFILLLWVNNTNLFTEKTGTYKLLAHRGLAQTFDISKVEADTNTAEIIYEPEHEYLENTIASMKMAFEYGADVIEFDVVRTKDSQLAVFHDIELSMITDGEGAITNYTMDELKKLDVGYGYTADGGKTFPFRGKGVGLMPELTEVLATFPDKDLLIHLQNGDLETAKILWTYLDNMSADRLAQITIYGDDDGLTYLREQNSSIRVLSRKRLESALLQYELLGWTGYIPKELNNMEIHIPLNYAKYLWGWPNKFVERMKSVNTRVVIVEGNGKWSEGFDTLESLDKIPQGFSGYVWTNRIDVISGN